MFDPEDTNGHCFVQLTAQYQEVAALNASVYAAKEATRQVIAESQPVVATLQVCTEKRARANEYASFLSSFKPMGNYTCVPYSKLV